MSNHSCGMESFCFAEHVTVSVERMMMMKSLEMIYKQLRLKSKINSQFIKTWQLQYGNNVRIAEFQTGVVFEELCGSSSWRRTRGLLTTQLMKLKKSKESYPLWAKSFPSLKVFSSSFQTFFSPMMSSLNLCRACRWSCSTSAAII